jgi:hypothetical protein
VGFPARAEKNPRNRNGAKADGNGIRPFFEFQNRPEKILQRAHPIGN